MGESEDRSAGLGRLFSKTQLVSLWESDPANLLPRKRMLNGERCLTDGAFGDDFEFERWRF